MLIKGLLAGLGFSAGRKDKWPQLLQFNAYLSARITLRSVAEGV